MNQLIAALYDAIQAVYGNPGRVILDPPAVTGHQHACTVLLVGEEDPRIVSVGESPTVAAAGALQQLVQHQQTAHDQVVQAELARLQQEHAARCAESQQKLEARRAPIAAFTAVVEAALRGDAP